MTSRANLVPPSRINLVIIDGHAILYRAYHALPPLTTSSGKQINAVFGFASMLLRVISTLKPTHLAVCFDTPKPTFRNKMYKDYQATRPKADKELISQIGLVHEVVEKMGIPIYEVDGYEADDVIATLAKQASNINLKSQISNLKTKSQSLKLIDNIETIIVTGDRDLLQLVSDRVKLYMPVKGLSQSKMYGEGEVGEKYGVKPEQMIDYKALVGDASDNYPGVNGVGPKTASNLLQCFETLEQIYENLNEVKSDRVRKNLKEGKESAELAKKLATIALDAPVELDLRRCKLRDLDRPDIHMLFEKLEFRSLISRLSSQSRKQKKSSFAKASEDKQKKKREKDNSQQISLF